MTTKYPGSILTDGAATSYSVAFDGTGDYISAPANAAFNFGTGDFTVEFWIYFNSTSGAQTVYDSNYGTAANLTFQFNSTSTSQMSVYMNGTSVALTSSVADSAGSWIHYACVRSGTALVLYRNGVSVATGTYSGNVGNSSVATYVGGSLGGGGYYVNGYLSNVRVVKGTAVYTANFTPPTQLANITNTSLLTCQQPTIVDASSNNFAITVAGNTQVSSFTPFPAYQAYNPALGGGTNGLWTLNQAAYAAQNQSWNMYDPYWKNTTLLLNGESAANGAQNNTFLDSSTNNFTITRNGNTTQGTFSPYGSLWSNYFDGSGDYLSVADNAAMELGSGNWTIEFWVNTTNSTTYSAVWTRDNATVTAGSYVVLLNGATANGIVSFWSADVNGYNAAVLTGTTKCNDGAWHHIAIVRNSHTLTLYIDGVSNATASYTGSFANTALPLNIGAETGFSRDYTGYISNARLVVGTALYTSAFTPPTSALTAVSGTALLTCQSNRFIDNSSNAFAITVNGDTKVTRFSPFNPTAPYSVNTIGGSGYFDGTGDYLTAPDNAAWDIGSAKTIEAWVYLTSGNEKIICGQVNQFWLSTGAAALGVTSGKFGISFYKSDNSWLAVSSTTSYAPNRWYHVAATWDGTYIRMFVNGVLEATSSDQSGTTWKSSSSGTFDIGTYSGDPNTWGVIGYISDVRITNSALYTSTFSIPTAPLPAVANTALLTHFTNAGIPDLAMQNDLETVGNAQVSTSVKKYGTGSLAFDGTGDYLVAGYNPSQNFGTGSFTIECWFYLNSLSSSYYVIGGTWNAGDSDEWLIQIQNNGSIRFLTSAGTSFYSASITTSTWYHFAAVRNGSTITVYVNGTSVGSYTNANSIGSVSKTLYIGQQNGGSWPFNGYIDDLRITKGYARYTANFTPPTSSLQNL